MSDPELQSSRSELAAIVENVLREMMQCVAGIAPERQPACLISANSIAMTTALQFQPKFSGLPELRWCGPEGQPAPPMVFPKDFVDRRSTVAWALQQLALENPVDAPIFSAQARVTLHHDALATFTNFNKPAARIISSMHPDYGPVPDAVHAELDRATSPLVYVVLEDMALFDDVIFYTAVFNFSRAFRAFQTGPWRALRLVLASIEPFLAEYNFSGSERRAVERAALKSVEQAWETTWQQPISAHTANLISILTVVHSRLPQSTS